MTSLRVCSAASDAETSLRVIVSVKFGTVLVDFFDA